MQFKLATCFFEFDAFRRRRDEMRTLGLIGGMSWESTAQYYRLINEAVRRRLGGLSSAKLLLLSVDFAEIAFLQHNALWDEAGALLARGARALYAGHAECLVLCSNTMHKVASEIEAATPLPLLHIADPTGAAAVSANARTVGLLGTTFTMEQGFYRERLESRFALRVLVPDKKERAEINRIIYDELCVGHLKPESRAFYRAIIHRLADRGAEAIILGCTEITLLVDRTDSPILILDTTSLHVKAAVDFSIPQVPLQHTLRDAQGVIIDASPADCNLRPR